jgi:SAM-dependent methyltransferase
VENSDVRYTHGHHESVLRSHRWRTAQNSAAYLLPVLGPGMDVLDVGCGPGTITVELADLTAPGRTVGIDSAGEALSAARSLGRPEVVFDVGDVMALAFDDGEFDVVHAHQVLQHLLDPVGALREMARVCRPGGFIAARDADYGAMTWHPGDPVLDRWLGLYRQIELSTGADPDAGRRLLSWALEAGLTDVTPSASVWCFATPEDRAWWGGLWADRVMHSGFARRAVGLGFSTEDELAEISQAWRRWAVADDGWFAVLHGEILVRRP